MEGQNVFTLLVYVASFRLISGSLDDVVITTTQGEMRGLVTSFSGRHVKVYWGIPYGKISARFQRAELAGPWEGVFEATTPPPSCPEVPYLGDLPVIPPTTTAFDEDCLYLNVWMPTDCPVQQDDDSLAVMVWIHGGAFEWGSSTVPTYNGQVLAATQCVIVVSINYRLGVLGFLSLGTPLAPGNVGLLDQNLALQWVHDNARHLGGSPDRITIFGESAGGMSIWAHIVSPLSHNLISRAIIQSGPTTSRWGKQTISENAENARILANIVGCPVDDDKAMIACLSHKDSAEMGLVAASEKRFKRAAFGIIVDGHFLHRPLTEPSLSKSVNKMNIMIGATKDDGSFVIPWITRTSMKQSTRPAMDRNAFYDFLEDAVLTDAVFPPKHKELAAKLVEYIYINSSLPCKRDAYRAAIDKMLGDLVFICPMYTTVKSLLGSNDVYMYSFEHRVSASPFPEWMGVLHASELDLVFGRPLDQEDLFTDEERKLSQFIMTSWANFAKFGDPNGDKKDRTSVWPALNTDTFPYAVLHAPHNITVQHGLRYSVCTFWNDLYTALVNPQPAGQQNGQGHDEL